MIGNYIKIALRYIFKHKLHSLINILGLAIAIACCLLLILFIQDELNYDSFHQHTKRIFRINHTFTLENTTQIQAKTPAPLATALKEEFPEVEYVTRFLFSEYTLKYKENIFTESVTFTDPDFFNIFSFNLIRGNPNEVLKDKNTILLSEKIARKYFGKSNPIGKQITLIRFGIPYDFTIEGIIEDTPVNSSIQYNILIPFEKLRDFLGENYLSNWGQYSVRTFIQLHDSAQEGMLTSKLPTLIKKYEEENGSAFSLQSLSDVHFSGSVQETMAPSSSLTYSYILGGITLLILLIASFNSMNISTTLASTRYKEIGVRKVMGAFRNQIIIQLCLETVIVSSVAFVLGIFLVELVLPTFNSLAEKTLKLEYFVRWYSFIWAGAFILFIGFLSGIFPSVLLSKFPPADLYQRKQLIGGRSSFSRSSIMIQFGLSIFLIVCTLVMSDQLEYLKMRNLGFKADQIIAIPYRGKNSQQTLDTYRTNLNQYTSVLNVSGAYSYPGGAYHTANATSDDKEISINHIKVDYDFLETFGITLKKGRNFSRNIFSDTTRAVIINEAIANRLGGELAIGKKMIIDWMGWEVKVIGIIENFHYASLHERIGPLVLYLDPFVPLDYFFVRIKPTDISQTLGILKDKWYRIVPDHPFEYFYLDQKFAEFYRSEERWSTIVKYSSIFAVFIACFGLFGLSALTMAKRTKEIGIRKVVGASVNSLITMLSKEFTRWIILANIIAWPIAYYVMDIWLRNFAYKINISWWSFVLAGSIGLVIALSVVGFQALKTIRENPIEALRYE